MTSPSAAISSLVEHVYLPLAKATLTKSEALATASSTLCSNPSTESLKQARQAWVVLRDPWKQAEVMSFGPHRLFPWRTESRVDFWPARPDDIDKVLDGNQDLSGDLAADTLGAANVGMPVAEYLLFNSTDTLSAFAATQRRCDYLLAVTRGIHMELQRFVDAWTGEYQNDLLHPEQGDRYSDSQEVFSEIVNNLTFTIELIREKKLAAPLGVDTGLRDPTLVESRFSGRSIQDALAALSGTDDVMVGCHMKGCGGIGIKDLLRERRPDLIDTYETLFDEARAAIKTISPPLTDAISAHPQQVQDAIDTVRALATFLQVEITQALNVTVTFGGTDGD